MGPLGRGLGGGGIGLLLLLLSKLFGKRGDASYSEHEIEHAGNLLDRMSRLQKTALWGEAQAQPDEIEKMACAMAKRYSRTHKVGKPPAKKGQFAAGNRFQGVKQAQGPSGNPITGTPLGPKPPPSPPAGGPAPRPIPAPVPARGPFSSGKAMQDLRGWLMNQINQGVQGPGDVLHVSACPARLACAGSLAPW